MNEQPTTTAAPAGANAPAREILCPLCDYNLRGLTEPRCPECGHRFDWEHIRSPQAQLHPYLFEHHPRRNLWSFCATQLGGLLPRRFWRTLSPSQPSRPDRLVLYWMICSALLIAGQVFPFAWLTGVGYDGRRDHRPGQSGPTSPPSSSSRK